MTATINDRHAFKSAHDALVFAFRFSGQAYERPLMNRLADDPVRYAGEKAGPQGLEGAGQAAMIWNQVMRLPDMHQFALYAAYGPKVTLCDCENPCCQGWALNPCWDACIVKIEEAAITRALAGCISHRVLRRQIVRRVFGDKSIELQEVAAQCEVSQNTASNHNVRIKTWIDGAREDGYTTGLRPRAQAEIEQLLDEAGIVNLQPT